MTTTEPGERPVDPSSDFHTLREAATDAMHQAYAPYSRFPVGAAGLAEDGRIVSGCNVENASYGVGLCAECGMVSDLVRTGGGRLVAVACVGADGAPLMPCGRCRQLLWEHGGPTCMLLTSRGPTPMSSVLPDAFGPHDLDRLAGQDGAKDEDETDAGTDAGSAGG